MVLKHRLLILAVAAAMAAAASGPCQAAGLGDRHVKLSSGGCALCHAETPPAKAPAESKCTSCHGDLKVLGNKPRPKGTVNPHLNHVEELYCADCHHMHRASTNYCEQCHDEKFLGMKVP